MIKQAILTVMVGPTVPVLAPPFIIEALESLTVTFDDKGHSGFQLSINMGRGREDFLDYKQQNSRLLRISNRIIFIVTLNAIPSVLFDGIITTHQMTPGSDASSAKLVVTGEDVSVMMDLEEMTVEHPGQDEMTIATKLILKYASYGLIPTVMPPGLLDIPLPTEKIPQQTATTDRQHLQNLAERFGYMFYIIPGNAPMTNYAYWGPPIRTGVIQRALSVNMGAATNVNSISFKNDGMKPEFIKGTIKDPKLGQALPVMSKISTRMPLSREPALFTNMPLVKNKQYKESSGESYQQALARLQGQLDASTDSVVEATGELDALKYGGVLCSRALVGVRGVGNTYGGNYYVKNVNHVIKPGSYTQSFTLTREGTGAILPVVIP